MLYNVAQMMKEAVGAVRHYSISETVHYPEERWGPLQAEGNVTLLRTPRGILVQAQVQVALTEECGRCVEPYAQELTAEIEEEFLPVTDVVTGLPLPLPRGEEPFTIDEKHLLDLTEALRQGIWVVRPIQPLCRPECAGLCPTCGQDLNQGPCGCAEGPVDPRWEQLKKLLA